MVCLPSSLDICLHVFSKYFPARLFEFQVAIVCVVCLVVVCSIVSLVSSVLGCVLVLSSSALSLVSFVLELWSGGLPGALFLSVLWGSFLGCFVPYVEKGGLFLCMVWVLFLGLLCMVCVREYG